MDDRTESTLTRILYVSLFFILIFILLQNLKSPWLILSLSGLLIASVTIRRALVYGSDRHRNSGRFIIVVDILLIFLIGFIDQSGNYSIFYFVIIGDAAIAYSYLFSGSIAALSYISYAVVRYIRLDKPPLLDFLPNTAFQALAFVSITAVMLITRYEIMQRSRLKQTMTDLKVKTKQLENTYVKLKKTSEDLEEMTILQERNRIAREIHDTVGDTLTTVLLEMEAGERLIKLDPDLAVEKIQLAKGQVRRGLNDIRESVRMLQSGKEILEFVPSLKLLMDETTQHGEIFIKYDISELPKLAEIQEKVIYRALQEGLTNGIRHGKSTAFVFKLRYENGSIKFFLQDNGMGSEKIVQGFGLTAMQERVKELGGIFNITSESGEGCCINISIPLGKENPDESHQSVDCG